MDKESANISLCIDLTKHPLTFVDSRDIPNRPHKIATISQGRQGERIYCKDHPGITLCASGGGVGGKTGLYAIGNNVRKLSSTECRRMFGFPDDFILKKTTSVIQSKFGNSVIVTILKSLINQIRIQKII